MFPHWRLFHLLVISRTFSEIDKTFLCASVNSCLEILRTTFRTSSGHLVLFGIALCVFYRGCWSFEVFLVYLFWLFILLSILLGSGKSDASCCLVVGIVGKVLSPGGLAFFLYLLIVHGGDIGSLSFNQCSLSFCVMIPNFVVPFVHMDFETLYLSLGYFGVWNLIFTNDILQTTSQQFICTFNVSNEKKLSFCDQFFCKIKLSSTIYGVTEKVASNLINAMYSGEKIKK